MHNRTDRLKNAGGILTPVLVAVAYLVAAKFGFIFAFATKQVTAVWPPTGIALAALLLWGYRVWPGIWLGAFLSNVSSAEPAWTAAAIATGNTLAPVLGSLFLRRFGFESALERVRDVLLLALLGAAVAMTVSATNGVIDLSLARIIPWSAAPSVWWVWWTGDAMGVLFITPLMLTWIGSFGRKEHLGARAFELALLGVTLAASSWVAFLTSYPLRLSVYPFVIWSALRFRQRETAAATAVVGGFAIWATTHGLGPFAGGSLDSRLIELDIWMAVFAITGLVLGAVSAEKRTARSALRAVLAQTKHSVETLQTALLPGRLPRRSGLRCDALYIAAERETLIGGDWYDAFELPNGRIAFSIGDVAGHGLDAAVTAAHIRRSIFIAAFEAAEPAEILAKAYDDLRDDLDVPATAMIAIVSHDLSMLSYASAGHPPAILAAPGLPARMLEYGGVPFGVGMPVGSVTHTAALEPAAVILFYTDGLVEFRRDIFSAEAAALEAVSQLVGNAQIERPATFVQRRVMGTQRPTDDTVLLVAQLNGPQAVR